MNIIRALEIFIGCVIGICLFWKYKKRGIWHDGGYYAKPLMYIYN